MAAAARRSEASEPTSPKDRFLTVYGHRPVQSALDDRSLQVDKVLIAHGEDGPAVQRILRAAHDREVPVERVTRQRVKLLAGNGKHDNGVLADVVAPRMRTLAAAMSSQRPATVLVLDGVRTPANVGMILRTATAAGIDGIVVPHRNTASLDPLVVKASAGVAFGAPVLRCGTATEAVETLRTAGYRVLGFTAPRADSRRGNDTSPDTGTGTTPDTETGTHPATNRAIASMSLYDADLSAPVALVVGSETHGLADGVAARLTGEVWIPMTNGVESLNVASAAAIGCFELVRRAAG